MSNCIWLKQNSLERCSNKSASEGGFCKIHSRCVATSKSPPPVPCKSCGCGTKSKLQLCLNCGRHNEAVKSWNKQRRKDFRELKEQLRILQEEKLNNNENN